MSFSSTARPSSSAPISSRSGRTRNTITAPTGCRSARCGCSATKILQFVRDGAAGIKPTHLAIIFDKSENSFRKEIYPAYKAHRPDPPDDLVPQFPLMRATVRAFGLTPIEQDRYEADDLIATYARQAREARRRRADRLRRQGSDAADRAGRRDVRPRLGRPRGAAASAAQEVVDYFGAPPTRSSTSRRSPAIRTDNVPGAPGIGVKTAAQLIDEYGDLDTLLARAGEIKQPKRRETLTNPENVELIRISKQLVKLVRDVAAGDAARRAGDCRARRQEADRLLEGDGVHDHHAPRRRDLRRRRSARSSPTRASSARPAGAAARRAKRRWRGAEAPQAASRAAAGQTDAAAPGAPTRRRRRSRRKRLADAQAPIDRSAIRAGARRSTSSKPGSPRAFEPGVVAFDTETILARSDAGRPRRRFAGARRRARLLHPARPSQRRRDDLFGGAGLLPGQFPRPRRSRC